MNLEQRIKDYQGKSPLLLIFQQTIAAGKKLSVGQEILAKKILLTNAIKTDDKSILVEKLKQYEVDWDKYSKTRNLFDHQKIGVNWLLNKSRGILADEMGLGKSLNSIVAAMESGAKRILIICPNILKLNWMREIGMVDDVRNVHVCTSKDFSLVKKWTIINYDIVQKFKTELVKGKFDILIADEAQNLKNLQAKRTKAIKTISLKCKKVWLLTGTPIANRPIDFYSLLKLCKHPIGSDKASYVKRFCGGILTPFGFKTDGASNLKELYYKTQDIILRRLKKDCLDLPEKILTPILLEIGNKKAYYNAPTERINDLYLESLDPDSDNYGRDLSQGQAFVELAVWRKYCALEKLKDESTLEFINEALDRDEKIVVFSSYLDVIDALKEKIGDCALTLDGRVSIDERQRRIDLFQNNKDYKVMICNVKVANAGLTLTAANNIVYNDLPWDPATLSQSIDRCHRIGTTKNVNVFFPIYKGTIDEVMLNLLQEKIININEAIEGKANTGLLNSDIRMEIYNKLKKIA